MKPQVALDRSPLGLLIGSTPAMREIHRLVQRMGPSRLPVLVLGETGTGKEVVARAIHDVGGRGHFVVIDCSSMVGPLMESELFGYSKGAFTGAHNQKLGLLDSADGGTAFFDEIGELPMELQMKLLRVLQEKQFRAVGSVGQRSSNFRVIAATNRDLAAEVQAVRFRADLFYRLNVMRLRIPPLRERREDVPVLIAHFLARDGNGHHLSDEVMASLCSYDWPGNVRELEHVVQQMTAMNSGPWLTPADLPSSVRNAKGDLPSQSMAAKYTAMGTPVDSPVIPLAEIEKRAILDALSYTKGDRTVAAVLLGIGRTTLYRKLKEYGV